MCGIVGFFGDGDVATLRKMRERLAHRGPDAAGEKIFEEERVFLGHRRLSIIDLSGGVQPMEDRDADHVALTFNGEIYNHEELRRELEARGARFRTDHSDTETLLEGYLAWGEGVVERLNGMFAFVIYDRKRRKLFGARDPFGQKPLYYAQRPEGFLFASELRALAEHPATRPKIDRLSLKKYFAHDYVPAPRTILEGVRKLEPGQAFEFDLSSRQLRVFTYWDFQIDPVATSAADAEEQMGELLSASVRRCLMSDVPYGLLLSGGLDSSSIATYAAEASKAALHTFSIGFQEAEFDESQFAKIVATSVGADHQAQTLHVEEAKQLAPEILGRLDEPLGDSSLLPTYLVSRMARERVTVALGGDGSDELFAGYAPFKALRAARAYSGSAPAFFDRWLRRRVDAMPAGDGYLPLAFKAQRFLRPLQLPERFWAPLWMSSTSLAELDQLFGEKSDPEEVFEEAAAAWSGCASPDPIDRLTRFFTKMYLPNDILVKSDRASMMNSLELRSPFLDKELGNFARKLPANLRFRGGKTKWILRKTVEKRLPRSILKRGKQGFAVPVSRWLRDESFADFRVDGSTLDATFLREQIAAHRTGRKNQKQLLWNYLVLEKSWVGSLL